MKLTKSGAIHKHSQRLTWKDWQPADFREMLWWETRHYLAMLDKYGGNSKAAGIVRAACRNLLEQLGGEQSL